jgi:hypothetical protein
MSQPGFLLVCPASLILLLSSASAQSTALPNTSETRAEVVRKSIRAVRVSGTVPTIDGVLQEAVWNTAQVARDFVQTEPNPGRSSSQQTEARVLYDRDAIYIGVRLFDSQPDSIVGQLARRDQDVFSDWFFLAVDSYYDRRTAFAFGINPRGVKVDLALFNDVEDDQDWDAIWDGAARIDSLGWTAEFRIPLSQVRFTARSGDAARTWGLNFQRRIARNGEMSMWSPLPPNAGKLVSLFGDLTDLSELQSPRQIEVVPYSVARLTRAPGENLNPFYKANALHGAIGGDLKFGITSNLTLTATFNPDFGQVEADPSVVNLSAYETFFPEKRPFFMEGADIFRFGIGAGDGDFGNEQLFYSRRVGRAPQGSVPDNTEYENVPEATTIVGAAKLSGKTASGWSVGLLNALTTSELAQYRTESGINGTERVEPLTNYAVARVIRDFRGGRSAVGAIVTSVNRDLGDTGLQFLREAAYSAGLNARHRFWNDNFEVAAQLLATHVRGDTSAIGRTQRSSARYFQRPDNDYTEYDPSRTALSGWMASLNAYKHTGRWQYGVITNLRSPTFEPNDLGFMRNADQFMAIGYGGYRSNEASRRFRSWGINLNQWNGWNFGGDRISNGGNFNGWFNLRNFWGGGGGINREMQTVSPGALRGGPAMVAPGNTSAWMYVYTDDRKPLRMNLDLNASSEDQSGGRSFRIGTTATVRPTPQAELSAGASIGWQRNAWQYVDDFDLASAPLYVFGELDQTTASLTTRVSYTISPTLSIQLYAQPFIAAGHYRRFREVRTPRADAFRDRFRDYTAAQTIRSAAGDYAVDRDADGRADFTFDSPDFNVKEMRSNLVARWEYRPGSTVYLVWSQGRSASDEFGNFRFSRDARDLWSAQSTNVLLVKFSYWLGL